MATIHEGGCLCRAVRYRVHGAPLRTLVCHCRFCQKVTGSSFHANSVFVMESIELTGFVGVYTHVSETSGQGVHLHFCPVCATTVSLTFERWPQYRAMSRGTFDDPGWLPVDAHIWTESAQAGSVLPAGTDCYRRGRVDADGTVQVPERFATPVPVGLDQPQPAS
ncbi:MAG TPA: GFA family protein [Ramlibacter sp.]|jgi:hypothetical protein